MSDRRRVAITGVGVVSPVGVGAEAFWDGLLAGRSGLSRIESFDTEGHRTRIAGEIRDFDALDWIERKAFFRLDRFCHFAIAAADMAVEDAAFEVDEPERVATVYSSAIGGLHSYRAAEAALAAGGPKRVSPFGVPSVIPNMAAGQIAIRFGFAGPSTCPVTACSSSADAIGWGFRLVRDGYADACMVGGAEACIVPPVIAGFANMHALSVRNDDPEAASRPFERDRDGFVLSEGAGALLLESLDGARARDAHVYAEVCGYGQSTDAHHETSPKPDGAGAAQAIRTALDDAGLEPADVDHVNPHGTSTPQNDVIEARALHAVLGERAAAVPVSGTKSMTGHLLGATGAIEAVACALAIRDQRVPPTVNHVEPDPECELDVVPEGAREARVDIALSNAMGFGGHNVCLAFRRPSSNGAAP